MEVEDATADAEGAIASLEYTSAPEAGSRPHLKAGTTCARPSGVIG